MEANKRNLIIGVLITITLILIPIITITSVMIGEKIRNDDLYEQSRDGILIEDRFLKHAEVVDYGGTTGRVLEAIDYYSFDIYAKAGDCYHFHWVSADINCIMLFMYVDGGGMGSSFWVHSEDYEFSESGRYQIEVWNYDDENDGYITTFQIVYDEYYPPECPLC